MTSPVYTQTFETPDLDHILMLYIFSSSYDDRIKDMAIVRGKLSEFDNGSQMLHGLGFTDLDEYVGVYPGNFDNESRIFKTFVGVDGFSKLDSLEYNKCGINIYVECADYDFIKDDGLVVNFEKPIPFMIPTLEEAAKCDPFNSLGHNDLWFCSDWTDSLEES